MRQRSSQYASTHRLSVAVFTLLTAGIIASTPIAGAGPDINDDNGVAVAKTPVLKQYRALRRMHAVSEKFNHEGWMEAWTELDGGTFRYEIVSERGSERIRNKVLKALLEREKELFASGEPQRAELTTENYDFAAETTGPGCKYILIKPKRKDSLLVDGRMVLSEDGRDLLRVEGKLSKNPSFWTSLVNIVRRYARLDGVRVPIATESNAKVKFVGNSKLSVEYEYETINGRPVSQQARRLVAANYTVSR
jgi:hypothetical protein